MASGRSPWPTPTGRPCRRSLTGSHIVVQCGGRANAYSLTGDGNSPTVYVISVLRCEQGGGGRAGFTTSSRWATPSRPARRAAHSHRYCGHAGICWSPRASASPRWCRTCAAHSCGAVMSGCSTSTGRGGLPMPTSSPNSASTPRSTTRGPPSSTNCSPPLADQPLGTPPLCVRTGLVHRIRHRRGRRSGVGRPVESTWNISDPVLSIRENRSPPR